MSPLVPWGPRRRGASAPVAWSSPAKHHVERGPRRGSDASREGWSMTRDVAPRGHHGGVVQHWFQNAAGHPPRRPRGPMPGVVSGQGMPGHPDRALWGTDRIPPGASRLRFRTFSSFSHVLHLMASSPVDLADLIERGDDAAASTEVTERIISDHRSGRGMARRDRTGSAAHRTGPVPIKIAVTAPSVELHAWGPGQAVLASATSEAGPAGAVQVQPRLRADVRCCGCAAGSRLASAYRPNAG